VATQQSAVVTKGTFQVRVVIRITLESWAESWRTTNTTTTRWWRSARWRAMAWRKDFSFFFRRKV
jgi:hypothetical protein